MNQIKSVYDNQTDIIKAIMLLNNIESFDVDLTYGNGKFWTDLAQPTHCFDLEPLQPHVIQASSTNIPLANQSAKNLIFDPPFLTYIKQGRKHNSIMGKRFSGYWSYKELQDHYTQTLIDAHRVLVKKGFLVIKCQDIIHNHSMHATHINILKWSENMFRLKDLFILTARHRLPMPEKVGEVKRQQRHARVHHSYFMVLEKL